MHAMICDILNLHKEITFIDKFQQETAILQWSDE